MAMHPLLNIALKAARRAGTVIVRALDNIGTIRVAEKQKHDFVTEVDRKAEYEIINTIRYAFPEHGILAEESGVSKGNEFTWIIDPLDGTTNFIHGFPHFCVSIAVKHKNRIEHGLIYDPLRQEVFSASHGQGAQLNNHRIRVSECKILEKALLTTGMPYRTPEIYEMYMKTLFNIGKESDDIRRTGSAALDLAYVAAGRLDGYWEFDLKTWDIAAGSLLVKEAGGFVSDTAGEDKYLINGNILAATPKIYKKLLEILQEGSPSPAAQKTRVDLSHKER